MDRQIGVHELQRDNLAFAGTNGISQNARTLHFIPAFRDEVTGQIELSRFDNGRPAPIHMLVGLPRSWAISFTADGAISKLKASITAGFVRSGRFYTRAEAAAVH